jgi:histidine triad (HIT) family protein
MEESKDCVFCKIIKREIPSFVVFENDKFLAILDIAQFTEGHTVVFPKEHFRFIWDIPYISEYYEFIKKVGDHLRRIGFTYIDTLSFGRKVSHAHVHLVPHHGNNEEWKTALSLIGAMQTDPKRRIDKQRGDKILKLLKVSELTKLQ